MRLSRADIFGSVAIIILSVFFVFDLFLTSARLASFDAPYHITNMAQFFLALKGGDFPVVWNNGIGNYGLPMGLVAHQLTNYLGAAFIFTGFSPENAYKLISFFGISLSSLTFYGLLRLYFRSLPSFASTVLYTLTSYKIINFYIRGAMPEIFAATFLPLILIGLYLFIKKRKIIGLFITSFSLFLLALNHPMMLLIYSFIYLPYLFFLLIQDKKEFKGLISINQIKDIIFVGIFSILGIGLASYYLLPLNLEIKYFYYGIGNHLTPNSFLGIADYLKFDWKYFTNSEIFPRGHIIFPGIIEAASILIGIGLILFKWIKKDRAFGILEFGVLISILILFFISPFSNIFYEKINILSNIQFPWRILSAFIFIPPIIYAAFLTKLNKNIFIFIFVALIIVLQFPQLYGKNYIKYPTEIYYSSIYNPHSVLMNPIWTGKSEDYPVKTEKTEILEGTGVVIDKKVNNSSRVYKIKADTTLKMVDYTFYFPGWNLYIDGNKAPIEFQDPNQRGVITYQVPQGEHTIELKFEDTRVREYAKILSLTSLIVFILLFVFRNKIFKIFKLKNETN